MNRNPACIDSSYSCWCHHCHLLGTILPDVFKKGCFACTGFTSKKNIAVALVNQLNRQLKHFVMSIVIHDAVNGLNKKRNIAPAFAFAMFRINY